MRYMIQIANTFSSFDKNAFICAELPILQGRILVKISILKAGTVEHCIRILGTPVY